jgi:hypothetical protein
MLKAQMKGYGGTSKKILKGKKAAGRGRGGSR